jgi:hypothetical protein
MPIGGRESYGFPPMAKRIGGLIWETGEGPSAEPGKQEGARRHPGAPLLSWRRIGDLNP